VVAEQKAFGLTQGLLLATFGVAGGLVADKLGIPAGMMIGPVFTVGAYRLIAGRSENWSARCGRFGRLILGSVIGAAVDPHVLAPLKEALGPMVVIVFISVSVSLMLGWGLTRFTELSLATGLIGVVPGGIPAMAAVADDLGADVTVVTAVHLFRLTTVLVVTPVLVAHLASGAASTAAVLASNPAAFGPTLVALALGLGSGLLAERIGLPSGDLVGPILVIGAANLAGGGLGPLHGNFQQAGMVLIGIAVGGQVSRESLRQLRQIAVPAAAVIATLISLGLLLGWLLSRVTHLDLVTALLSSVPGGASTMPMVAHELGGDMRLVAALHLTRQLVLLVVLPSVLGRFLRGRRRGRISTHDPSGV
jgi:membrane AbrB-like protein